MIESSILSNIGILYKVAPGFAIHSTNIPACVFVIGYLSSFSSTISCFDLFSFINFSISSIVLLSFKSEILIGTSNSLDKRTLRRTTDIELRPAINISVSIPKFLFPTTDDTMS